MDVGGQKERGVLSATRAQHLSTTPDCSTCSLVVLSHLPGTRITPQEALSVTLSLVGVNFSKSGGTDVVVLCCTGAAAVLHVVRGLID